jgi:hypothetical protein
VVRAQLPSLIDKTPRLPRWVAPGAKREYKAGWSRQGEGDLANDRDAFAERNLVSGLKVMIDRYLAGRGDHIPFSNLVDVVHLVSRIDRCRFAAASAAVSDDGCRRSTRRGRCEDARPGAKLGSKSMGRDEGAELDTEKSRGRRDATSAQPSTATPCSACGEDEAA